MRKTGWSRRAGAMMVLLLGLLLLPGLACAKGPAGTVLVLGDSLSAAHNIPADAGWVSLLQQRVRQQSKTPARIVNASMSGNHRRRADPPAGPAGQGEADRGGDRAGRQ